MNFHSKEQVIQMVNRSFSSVTGHPVDQIDLKKNLSAYQIDSIQLLQLVGELEKTIGEIPLGDLANLRTLNDIVDYIYKKD